ncbi:uncharacterized protein BDW47DRAFT_90383 [Aspergillus candidus]|uniref:Uncharacterized protein n=1 Tax=Aspergillus candidus TaxID=41067 RepID=A0A2I2EZ82_ASPCN|nr:hypothetical protein BDW47DRAFT_90383 [Aspergillus candidus]PLB33682.1 hypothetical protein BDW47DRAFT_90383 [Aspergillus candidus]
MRPPLPRETRRCKHQRPVHSRSKLTLGWLLHPDPFILSDLPALFTYLIYFSCLQLEGFVLTAWDTLEYWLPVLQLITRKSQTSSYVNHF